MVTDSVRPEDLILHRKPMLLIDDVVTATTDTAESIVRITEETSFYQANLGVPSWIGLEYMAQTIGLTAGVLAQADGEGAPLGYLLGTRKYKCNSRWFPLGSTLKVSSSEELYDGTLGVYSCEIEEIGEPGKVESVDADKIIKASARLTVYRAEN